MEEGERRVWVGGVERGVGENRFGTWCGRRNGKKYIRHVVWQKDWEDIH